MTCKYYYGVNPSKVFSPIFSRTDLGILKTLGSKQDLVVCKPDKGKGVVLLDKHDCIQKMNEILQDTSKFTS